LGARGREFNSHNAPNFVISRVLLSFFITLGGKKELFYVLRYYRRLIKMLFKICRTFQI
jgi:hypothetical protein